jgi:hypothetical protein
MQNDGVLSARLRTDDIFRRIDRGIERFVSLEEGLSLHQKQWDFHKTTQVAGRPRLEISVPCRAIATMLGDVSESVTTLP